jgi:hypothetical protein
MVRALKILVSVGLIGYLLYAVDWRSAIAELGQAQPIALLIAILILFAQILVSAWKWQISLSIHALEWPTGKLVRIILIALFFNNFLPTAVGGDIYRAYRTFPASGTKTGAVSAILLDRVVGLLSLLFVGAIGAAVIFVRDGNATLGWLSAVFALPVMIGVVLPSLLRSALFRPLLKKLARVPKLEPLVQNARSILGNGRKLINLLGVSILFQTLAILAIVLLFAAVRTTGIVAESAVVGTTYAIASLLPISINGLGVMEGSFALTARNLGIAFDSAVVVSLVLRLAMILPSLLGGVVFLWDKGRAADGARSAIEKSSD